MKFTVEREHLLKPLQQVSGPLEWSSYATDSR